MPNREDEDRLLRSVARQNSTSIQLARQRSEEALVQAKDALETKTRELAESLALMRATLEATHDAILVTDVRGAVTHFNEQFVEMWRFSRDLLEARQHRPLLDAASGHFADPESFLTRVAEIYGSLHEASDELRLRDGRIIERFSKLQQLEGRAVGRVWTFRDVTERKRVEELRFRLAAVVESSDDAIVSKTLDGIVTTWNAGAERMFGFRAEEIIGKPITLLFPPDRIPEEEIILGRMRRGERVEHYETQRVRKDGMRIDVSLTVSPVKDSEGRIIGAAKIARDITDRARAAQAIKDSEVRLRAVVETTPECVLIVAPDGRLEFMNHAGIGMIDGESETDVQGVCVFDLIASKHRDSWIERHDRVCAGERLSWEFEMVGVKGSRRWMETNAVPLSLPDGRVAHLAVARDITAQRQYEVEREELLESERTARAEAERASQLKDEFLATLSHELRTPLSAILGWSQLLATGGMGPADLAQGLEAIERNARAQTQLIEDLLDMSRIISGKVRLDVQWTDLASVVNAAVDSVRPAADAKEILLRKILDSGAGPVSGDPTRLQQVVWNLLSNAIKFTPKGGKVDVLLQRVDSHLEILVHDSGIGIKPEFLPMVFERFRQGDSSTTRYHSGLGLGLSIVKSLVEMHGGTVRARSGGEGQGATFIVNLPLAPIRNSEDREHPATPKAATLDLSQLSLKDVKVLVVDDEPDARALISRVLTQCSADVVSAATATDGLHELRRFRPDVLVSDIGMPEMDGYQFMREVRKLSPSQGGKTPAIALTAFARSQDRTKAMIAGYTVHISKPIEPQELAATVGSLAGRIGSAEASAEPD